MSVRRNISLFLAITSNLMTSQPHICYCDDLTAQVWEEGRNYKNYSKACTCIPGDLL